MKTTTHILRRPIMILALAGGALIGGCSTAAVDIGLQVFYGLTAGLDTSELLNAWLQGTMQGG
ncbi:MAG: hypothetical protein JXQ73_20595 [Phycisphaerae bacterium]|nr:hypothetical protein [Phycisphaerae bacterium]